MRTSTEVVRELNDIRRKMLGLLRDAPTPEYAEMRRKLARLEIEFCDALRAAGHREPRNIRKDAERILQRY